MIVTDSQQLVCNGEKIPGLQRFHRWTAVPDGFHGKLSAATGADSQSIFTEDRIASLQSKTRNARALSAILGILELISESFAGTGLECRTSPQLEPQREMDAVA